MKRLIFYTLILTLGFFSCTPKIDYKEIIPTYVDEFATGFITQIHSGNIDTCLTMMHYKMDKEKRRQFLTNTYFNILTYNLDSCRIINARKAIKIRDNRFVIYTIEYEYITGDKFLYFQFVMEKENNRLSVTDFDGMIKDEPLSKAHDFTLQGKGFLHYLFLFFAVSMPVFILISLVFILKTKLKRKWLWIIGVLFGFIKFKIIWTTGQVAYSLISISFLGAGYFKTGIVAPWIISFSIPVVAIVFWYERFRNRKETEAKKHLDGKEDNQFVLEK